MESEDSQRWRVAWNGEGRAIVRCALGFGCALVLIGCATDNGVPMIGSRPLLYNQGPGDEAAQRQQSAGRAGQAAPASTPSTAAAVPPAPSSTPSTPPPSAVTTAPATPATSAPSPAPAPGASTQATAAAPPPAAAAPVAAQATMGMRTLPAGLARYTQATRYGDLLFLSGQIGIDPHSGDFAPDALPEAQARQALENVRTVLEVHGLTMANIVSVTLYVANINSLGPIDGVYASFFKSALPARSVVEVQRLPRGAQVEITVVAGR